ncbi:MAG TPA: dihydrofolate reductase family protein [Cyclobacteriaceae bacterium]|nr:dihydrofolate reductase family protein [Cyclobacteriaceae bacterium]
MRTLKLQMQVSVDGYVGGLNGELDWMLWDWSEDLKKFVGDLTDPIDCILMGRKMTDGFVQAWKKVRDDPQNPMREAGIKFYDTTKVVFTKTFQKSTWENVVLAKGDIEEEVKKLKNQKGGDLMVYGGSNFVMNLIKHNLIDDYYLFINPTAQGHGNGLPIFSERKKLKLIKSQAFECGIVLLNYKPADS